MPSGDLPGPGHYMYEACYKHYSTAMLRSPFGGNMNESSSESAQNRLPTAPNPSFWMLETRGRKQQAIYPSIDRNFQLHGIKFFFRANVLFFNSFCSVQERKEHSQQRRCTGVLHASYPRHAIHSPGPCSNRQQHNIS